VAPCIQSDDKLGGLAHKLRNACLSGDSRQMENLFRQIVELDENCADAWYGLGMLSMQDGQFEDAYDYLSEFVAVAELDRDAEDAEVLLCFLERTLSGEGEIHNDLLEEVDEHFLMRYFDADKIDEPYAELGRLTVREAVNTTVGRYALLALIREDNVFKQAALDRGLAVATQAVPVNGTH
jgi:tetratricopeptide (TPR) repeat protein